MYPPSWKVYLRTLTTICIHVKAWALKLTRKLAEPACRIGWGDLAKAGTRGPLREDVAKRIGEAGIARQDGADPRPVTSVRGEVVIKLEWPKLDRPREPPPTSKGEGRIAVQRSLGRGWVESQCLLAVAITLQNRKSALTLWLLFKTALGYSCSKPEFDRYSVHDIFYKFGCCLEFYCYQILC